jgi:O-antigen/teichoic acid export membrane protein
VDLLKKNIAANFVGSFLQSLMTVLFIPIYVRLMWIDAYALVGFFAILQAIFGLLDMGLSSTLNREMARLSILPGRGQEMRNLVRTLETIYWIIAVLVGIIAVSLAPFLSNHFFTEGKLSHETVEQSFLIMGLIIAIQMPVGFYSGGLMGLQKQVLMNIINVIISALRGVGVILILWLISPTIQAYFLWQITISIINIFLLVLFLQHNLPHIEEKAIFQKSILDGIWKFTAGMSGIALMGIIVSQIDKIFVFGKFSQEMSGYYTIATTVAISLGRFYSPVFYSIYPQFTQLFSIGDKEGLTRLYHKSSQFISVLVLPAAVVLMFFSYEVLLIWQQSEIIARQAHVMASILICGTALNGLMNPPYALQLASGWTSLSIYKNIIALIIIIPLIIYMTGKYGAVGAACSWFILNLGYVLFEIPVMHMRILHKEKWRWYWQDVGIPLGVSILFAGIGRLFIRGSMPQIVLLLWLIIISALTLAATAFITPVTRAWLLKHIIIIKARCFGTDGI